MASDGDLPFKITIHSEADTRAIEKTTDLLEKQSKEMRAAGAAGGDVLDEARASFDAKFSQAMESLKASQTEVKGLASAAESTATSSLPKLGAALGAAGVVAGVLGSAVRTLMADNKGLSDSFDNLRAAGSQAWSELVRSVAGDGSVIKEVIDNITVAMGGQTEEQKQVTAAMADYIALAPQAKSTSEVIAEGIKRIGEVAAQTAREIDILRTAEQGAIDLGKQADDADLQRQRDKITNSDASPEEKQSQLSELDKVQASEAMRRKREELIQQRDQNIENLDQQRAQAKAADDEFKAQEERVKKLDQLTTARAEKDRLEAQAKEALRRKNQGADPALIQDGDVEAWKAEQKRLDDEYAAVNGRVDEAKKKFDEARKNAPKSLDGKELSPEDEKKALGDARRNQTEQGKKLIEEEQKFRKSDLEIDNQNEQLDAQENDRDRRAQDAKFNAQKRYEAEQQKQQDERDAAEEKAAAEEARNRGALVRGPGREEQGGNEADDMAGHLQQSAGHVRQMVQHVAAFSNSVAGSVSQLGNAVQQSARHQVITAQNVYQSTRQLERERRLRQRRDAEPYHY